MSNILRNDDCWDAFRAEAPSSALRSAGLALRLKLAEDRQSSATILGVLSCHCDERVRAAVADNPSTPYMTLLKLARDKSDDIRYQLAENHNVPTQVLLVLVSDENPFVRARAERTLERLRAHKETSPTRLPVLDRDTFVSLYRPQ